MPQQVAVFFDLDATLVAYDTAVADRLVEEMWLETLKLNPGLDLAALTASHRPIVVDLWRKAEADISVSAPGSINGLDIMFETFSRTLATCGCDDLAVAQGCFDYYWKRRAGIFGPYDDVVITLESLRPTCKLAVITNGPCVTQRDKLEILGLDRYFDLIVCSGDVGAAKPDEAIFRHVLQALDATPATAIHVGDNLMADVGGANGAGLTSVWINRTGYKPAPDDAVPAHEITSLLELESIVQKTQENRS